MKTSAKLFILLSLFCIGGLATTNYALKKQYDVIDKTNPYYTFDKLTFDAYEHISVIGGNVELVHIEASEDNCVYADIDFNEELTVSVESDTLKIIFSDHLQRDDTREIRTYDRPAVLVKTTHFKSVSGSYATLKIDSPALQKIDLYMDNYTSFVFNTHTSTQEVNAEASGASYFDLSTSPEAKPIRIMQLKMQETSTANFNRSKIDSVNLNLEDDCLLTAGPEFFRKS